VSNTVWTGNYNVILFDKVALAPALRPFEEHMDCAALKQRAFDAHSGCYLSPYPGAPSICDVSVLDWGRVLWTIKAAFISDFIPSAIGMVQVSSRKL
jgi:hypothetical protein